MAVYASQMSNSTQNNDHFMDDPVEICDSSDEDDDTRHQTILQLPDSTFAFQFDNSHIKSELNDFVQSDTDNGSHTKMPEARSIGLDYHKEVLQSQDGNGINTVTDSTMGEEALEVKDGSSIETKMKRSARHPRKMVNARSTPKSLKSKMPANQFKIKKHFTCQICQHSSNDSTNFKRHMHTHTGEKPFQCDICRQEFTRLANMKKHKVTHTEQIPFHCRGCFKGFFQKSDQASHEKVCKSRRYECHICKKYVNVDKAQLKRHMRNHNGEKPFRCEICMKRFTQKSSLKDHLGNIHTRINP
ncbi:zinc finger protein 2-like [Contarinia nasturtii]|uniref:zinc finger protein 2-like n=1 Tax=Contarinia nasturtii TaxID=265458 RepID=UPI0012D415B9|nr:zinc finger protein 2-like [Contarinia nasturtii]